ncbi:MAG TPA: CNNM domain-containing protein [Exilispira sp.]|nr:CNNM domain-containing protein [Exilispira sp.]
MSFLLTIFIILLAFSAFFSSTETIFYLSDEKTKNRNIKINNDLFLIFILISNTLVNIFIGIISEKIFTEHILKDKSILFTIGITTFILLFFGEIIPKRMALILYPIVKNQFLYIMQKWIDLIRFFEKIINFFIKPISKINQEDKIFTIKEIKKALNDGIKNGYFNPLQAYLISNLISQSLSTVKDNMIHYSEIPFITNNMNIKEVYELAKKTDLHKLPVVSKNMKNIYGFISKGDILNAITENKKYEKYEINSFVKPLDMIYEFESIEFAIKRFIEKGETILGVYDEYFQYCGIIDYHKIINNMLFNFSINTSKKFPLLVPSNISCRSLFYNYDIEIKEEDFDLSLNDLLLNNLEKIPKENDFIIYQNYKFIIAKIKNKKIAQVIIEKLAR